MLTAKRSSTLIVALVLFGLALTAIYTLNFIDFLRHPEQVTIGYKG
jgi:hypothetical protein